jgi:hypothetical protein
VGILLHITNSLLEGLKQKIKGNEQTKEIKRLEAGRESSPTQCTAAYKTSARMEHASNQ